MSENDSRPESRTDPDEGTKEKRLESPEGGVRSPGDGRAIVELETTPEFVEWMELEAAESTHDGIAEWALTQLQVALTRDLQLSHGVRAEVDVDLPEEYAERVELYYRHQERLGLDPDLNALVFNHMDFQPNWRRQGERWELAEQAESDDTPPQEEDNVE